MVRLAIYDDAEQLKQLNNEFNGLGDTTLEKIQESLLHNQQEFVVVEEINKKIVGFICVQLKKSFCYEEYMVEITEAYVKDNYRHNGIAARMITFAEEHCKSNYPFHKIELLTGRQNHTAQKVYDKLGYKEDSEIHLSKRFKR